jgi:cytochrome bd-type quinol oxidase subunit 1
MKNIYLVMGVGLIAIYAIGSGIWVNTGDDWYREFNALL